MKDGISGTTDHLWPQGSRPSPEVHLFPSGTNTGYGVCVSTTGLNNNCALGTLMSSHSITIQFSQQPHYDRYGACFSNIITHTQEAQ